MYTSVTHSGKRSVKDSERVMKCLKTKRKIRDKAVCIYCQRTCRYAGRIRCFDKLSAEDKHAWRERYGRRKN